MSHLNSSYETDIDSFLNLDQADYTPLSASPNTKVPSLSHQSSLNSHFGGSSQQTFSGPSFQYDAHRQQTGLPVGGLANTFAVNQASGLHYYDNQGGFVMPSETLNIPLSNLDEFDFARHPSFDMTDMDFDGESPSEVSNFMMPGGSSSQGQFVSPNTLIASDNSPLMSTPIHRMYPGMHSQQAAQAKAQQAQKQQEIIRQQQTTRPLPSQKPLPSQPKSATKDPVVEESISRLLSQMRHNSVVSSTADEESTPTNTTSAPRIKKDEDDMDEDERLLASEEGKKLSSKERRQLRNKVSARAFRSRRKEYIGQLEGEVAGKVKEADDLRAENRQLREENARLTDLTRMLLSSQAFSGFLQELSQSSVPNSATIQAIQPQPVRKDINPHEAARQLQSQQQPQIGMALMPETTVDMSLFEAPSWNHAASNDFHVYAVTELPEAPVISLDKISEKPSKVSGPFSKVSKDFPTIPAVPVLAEMSTCCPPTVKKHVAVDEMDLGRFNSPKQSQPNITYSTFAMPDSKKSHIIPVTISITTAQIGTWETLEKLCCALDETSDRLTILMPY